MNMSNENNCDKPLISFILTCYNLPEDMVRECLDSIMNLSLRPCEREIVVVDDGSDACMIDSMKEYRDSFIYIRQKNSGPGAARNTGLKVATGKNIQFVDGDDKLVPYAYERCLDIVRYNDPDMVLFDSTNKKQSGSAVYLPKPVDGTQYLRHNNLHATAWGYIFNRRILQNLRFTPGLLHEDEEFTPQLLLRAETVYSTNIVAYFYRKRPLSITDNKSKRYIIKRLNDIESIIFHLQDIADSLPVTDMQAMQRRVAQLTMDYIVNIIKLTHSSKQLNARLKRLESKNLFPLPYHNYTAHYSVFRKLTKNKITRKLLALALKIEGHIL